MKSMWVAFVAMAVISVGAWYALGQMGWSSADQTSGASVRLD